MWKLTLKSIGLNYAGEFKTANARCHASVFDTAASSDYSVSVSARV
ncbi:hypothetical protein ENHYD8BJ_90532 [Enhydrobacter sp. 8BJ]|nr:hypothetical protein ENHYD8BJ_90532 [Enhydrobacter sp. 8BJ]